MNKTITLAVAATCALCAGSTFAAEYALGAGIHMNASEYKGADIEVVPAPIMNAETEYFYLHGLEAGGYLLKSPKHAIMLGVSYMPLEFDAGDSDDHQVNNPRRNSQAWQLSHS